MSNEKYEIQIDMTKEYHIHKKMQPIVYDSLKHLCQKAWLQTLVYNC